MKMIKPPKIIKKLFKKIIWDVPSKSKEVFLTFDDCSDYELTIWTLETLKSYDIKGTFFCIGKHIQKTDLLDKIKKDGHTVGNHTFNHINGFKSSTSEYLKDIEKCNNLVNSKYFRPPYGKITLRQIKKLNENYKIVLWSIISYDFDKKVKPEQCFNFIKKNIKPGSILVFHTSKKAEHNMKFALTSTIEYLTDMGFSFKRLQDCQ